MREILDDLGNMLSHEDPVKRAQIKSRKALPKRFYKTAAAAATDGGYCVQLDGKSVRTPARALLILPTRQLADHICDEWNAQVDEINPVLMPITRLANTTIDGIAVDPQAVIEDILRFAGTDLLCYRADTPQALVDRQSEAWDPILDWAHASLSARFLLAEGVMHIEQPRGSINALGIQITGFKSPFALAALHSMVSLSGSALLAIAVGKEHISADEAWHAAHIDEDWNIEQWGRDGESEARRTYRWGEMQAADRVLRALAGA